jgi:hypothetical protein
VSAHDNAYDAANTSAYRDTVITAFGYTFDAAIYSAFE